MRLVIALGGNALGETPEKQKKWRVSQLNTLYQL